MKLTIDEIGFLDEIKQRLEIELDDTSMDSEIENLSSLQRVRLIAGWELGDESWADTFKEYFESQCLWLTTNSDDPNII